MRPVYGVCLGCVGGRAPPGPANKALSQCSAPCHTLRVTLPRKDVHMDFEEKDLPISSLLLDPNNFRYQDESEFVTADERRFHEESVQDRAYRRLRRESLAELKKSILTNGFLPVERLVVRPYGDSGEKYVVVEGNRRLAALRWIDEDHAAGVEVPPQALSVLDSIPVIVLPDGEDESVYLSIMGIRHVSGIRQWGPYQRAKLVTELRDRYGLEPADVAERIGMSTQEVNRRYRAFKALGQMQLDRTMVNGQILACTCCFTKLLQFRSCANG